MTTGRVATTTPVGTPATTRRADIQGLRAVAVIMVLAYHAGLPVPGGFMGVDIFFVISGYVITALLVRELQATGSVRFRRFYSRRARRLLPALALMIVVTCLASVALLPLQAQGVTGSTGVAAALFVANYQILTVSGGYFDAAADSNALLHTWSLSVEEQFYVGFPALLLLGWALLGRRGARRAAVLALVAGVTAASFALSLHLSAGRPLPLVDSPQAFAFLSAPTRVWEFGAGAVLALVASGRTSGRLVASGRVAAIGLWLGAATILAAGFLLDGAPGYPGWAALVPVAGTVLVIATADHGELLPGRFLQSRPLVTIGELSYSLYLWHWPFVVLGMSALGRFGVNGGVWASTLLVVASVAPAWASYRWVERPIRAAESVRGFRLLGLVAACMTIPIVVGAGLQLGADRVWGDPSGERWEALRTEMGSGRAAGCHVESVADLARPLANCTFGSGSATIYVTGDSHADAIGDSVIAAVEGRGFQVVIRSASVCPMLLDGVAWQSRGSQGAQTCARSIEQRLDEIATIGPALVVIANRSPAYVNPSIKGVGEQGAPCPRISTGPGCATNSDLADRWGRSLRATMGWVESVGSRVLVVATVPEHPNDLGDCTFRSGVDEACATHSTDFALQRRQAVVAAERRAVSAVGSSGMWDPWSLFCDESSCRREHASVPTYRDDDHVNPSAAALLADPLWAAISTAVGP